MRTLDDYIVGALSNVAITSRTARGTLDASSSNGKRQQLLADITNLEQRVQENYRRAISYLFRRRLIAYFSADLLSGMIFDVAQSVNESIVVSPRSFRGGDDSTRYAYTAIADLSAAYAEFVDEFWQRLQGVADPVGLAAWVEWRIDCTDHFFADGCGRIAKAIAAWVLMRHDYPLPRYELAGPDVRTAYYAANLVVAEHRRRGTDPSFDDHALAVWTHAYRRYFAGPAHDCASPAIP